MCSDVSIDRPTSSSPPTVYLLGAGPGDPELLTIKAVRAIRQATVLLVDDLVGEAILRYARRSARIVRVGKRGGCRSTPQAFIERLMIAEARSGERVVRLKGGDPFIFGRGGEELEHLRAAGIGVEVVSGVTSAMAAAAAIGVPLTHRAHAHGVLFVTGHARSEGAAPSWAALGSVAAQGITLVVYMGIGSVNEIESGLLRSIAGNTPAAIVENASLPQERYVRCRLDELSSVVSTGRIGSPAIMIIGDVARGCDAVGLFAQHSTGT
jgi:uroporphyrin-III C-methyltransferase